MTFVEKYQKETTWHGKATVMEIFHLTMQVRKKDWTITKTAEVFEVSVSLVSENLKLAQEIHVNETILACKSRMEALSKINGRNLEAKRLRIAKELAGGNPD